MTHVTTRRGHQVRSALAGGLALAALWSGGAEAALQQVPGGFLFSGPQHQVLISETNGSIVSITAPGGGLIAAGGEAGLWSVAFTTNSGSSSKTGDVQAAAFSSTSSSNVFQWALSPATNLLFLTYSNAALTVVVTASNREDGVEFSASVTPRATNVYALTLPAPLRFEPAALDRFIAPNHSSDGVGMAYNKTFFQAQDEDSPASWKSSSVGPSGYVSLYGGECIYTNYDAVPISFTTNGVVWLGAGLSSKWSSASAVVHRPPAAGQADVVLLDSPHGAFFSGSDLGGTGLLMRVGGLVGAADVPFSLDVVGAALEHLAQASAGRTNIGLLSMVRGPVIGTSWPSEVRIDEWRDRLSSSAVLASNGISLIELSNIPEMMAALVATNFLAILNPYGELVPSSLSGGVPSTVTNIGQYVRAGGYWFEVAGYPFYQTLQPELYYTNNLYYPPVFADFFQVETTNGHAAIYGVQPQPADPWAGATNPASVFVPGRLIWGGDAQGGWLQRAFATYVATNTTWTSPGVRLSMGKSAPEALQDYSLANAFSRGLTNKMSGSQLARFQQSVMIHYKGGATQLTARLPDLPAPALLHFEEYLYGGFDKQYPDHLPPNATFGTSAEFTNFLAQARQRNHLTMPYTNPTFWGVDPKGPTFLATNDAPLLVNPDGTYNYEEYFGAGGMTVTPWHPAVQAANRHTRNQFLTNYPVDVLFQDQVGARTWQYDLNPASPNLLAYIGGVVAIAAEDSQLMPVSTENGWDHLINHEAQFSGLAWGLAPTTNAPFWRRYLRERYAPSTWEVFPLAQYLAHDKVAFIYNNLSAAVHNHEVMAWTLGLGYGMTYVIHASELDEVAKRQWLLWVDRVQKSVVARYQGQGVNSFSHRWGTNTVNPDNGAMSASYGPVSVVGNLSSQSLSTNGWTLPGYGYLATASGLVAGHLIAPGAAQAAAYVAETNGSGGLDFWIYSAGGTNATMALPAGFNGAAALQVETNSPTQVLIQNNVLTVTLPSSAHTLLWAGRITPDAATTLLIDFGRHDSGTNGLPTDSPDDNGNYWNNLGPVTQFVSNGTKRLNLISTANGATTVGIELTSDWEANGKLNGGLLTPSPALLGPLAITNATMDYFFTTTSDTFRISGLNTGSTYDLTFFGTRDSTETRISTYTVATNAVSLTTSGTGIGAGGANLNNNTTAVLRALAPDATGEMTVTVSRTSGFAAYIGILKIDEHATAAPANPGILALPSSLSFTGTAGGADPASQSFGLTNVGSGTLNYTLSTNASWLSVSPSTGSLAAAAGQQVTVSVNTAGMQAGTSNATITISDPAATNSPQAVSVILSLGNQASEPVTNAVFFVDFGRHDGINGNATVSPDSNGRYWNNISGRSSDGVVTNTTRIGNMVTTTNGASGLGLEVTSGSFLSNGRNNGGLIQPYGPTNTLLGDLAMETATEDYFFTSGTDSFKLTGLDPDRYYTLSFFGSRSDATERVTSFAVGFTSTTLRTSGPLSGASAAGTNRNDHALAVLNLLAPGPASELTVSVAKVSGAFAHLNLMRIEELSLAPSTNPGPGILVSPGSLSFITTNGAGNPAAQSFALTNVGTLALNYSIASNASWLSVSPGAGALAPGEGQSITVTANAAGLSVGTANALLMVSDPAATNNPQYVSVSLQIKSDLPVLTVFGSSVAKGWNSSGHLADPDVLFNGSWSNGYAYFIARQLTENSGYYVTNASTPGDNTGAALGKFSTHVAALGPTYVLLAYSLGNEGLAGSTEPTSSAIVSNFTANLLTLIGQCRSNGYYPVLSSVYPHGSYTAGHYALLKQMHQTINAWDVPSLNLLTPLDDGSGRWINGYWSDGSHPNDAGYLEFYYAFVPSLFAAIQSGKTNSPIWGSPTNFARLTRITGVNAPLTFTPSNTVHAFTTAFRLRTSATGTIAAVRSGSDYATLEVRTGQLIYVDRAGAETVVATNLADDAWHDVALSARYALSNTALYVDGALAASVAERWVPDQFILGGPGASGRAATPSVLDLDSWCVYRAGWTPDEAQAQKNGDLQQSSMEVGAMMDESTLANGGALLNAAQSLSAVAISTPGLTAWTPDTIDTPKLLVFGSSVAKGYHGPDSPGYTNGSYLLGYAGLLTPVLEAGGWTVTNGSVGGNDTAALLARFDADAVPVQPDVILLGLSMGNEGLLTNDPEVVFESFRSGMNSLIQRSRSNGFYPVVTLNYPNQFYSATHYQYIKRMNLLMNSWDVPSLNLLGPVDDGSGKWADGYWNDNAHPNPAGHEELFRAIAPSLFAAIAAGRTNTPHLTDTHGYARLQGLDTHPLTFTPSHPMRSFNSAFRVRSGYTGTVAVVMTATSAPPASPATFLVDFGRHDGGSNGTATVSPDVNGNYWNNLSPANPTVDNVVTNGAAINNMVTISNTATAVRLEITSSEWAANGKLNGGLLSPSNSLLGRFAIGTATEDYFFHGATGTFKIAGLNPSSTYKLRFFGTRQSAENRVATFTVGAASTNLQTSGTGLGVYAINQNDSIIAELPDLYPDGNGEIAVSVARAGLSFAHLGILEIVETPAIQPPAGGAVELRGNALVYVATNGAEIAAPVDADGGGWIDVALSHSYARGLTLLYVDGVLAGTTAEQLAPVQFVLGGPGALTNRPAAPTALDVQDWCVYRAPWTPEEALAQYTGALQQASMEICAPLDDTAFAQGGGASNRAQSLAPAYVSGANLAAGPAMPAPGTPLAESPAYNTVRLTWSDLSGDETGFVVERRPAGGNAFWSNRVMVAANTTNYTEYGVAAGTYEYRVSAQRDTLLGDYADGAITAVSNPPFSTVITIDSFRFTGGQAGVSFVGSNAVAYLLQFSTNLLDPAGWHTVQNVGQPAAVIGNGVATNMLSDTDMPDHARVYRLVNAP